MINGQKQDIPQSATVSQLIELRGLVGRACAVEVNKELVPRSEHNQRTLSPGDHVELVTLVGGG